MSAASAEDARRALALVESDARARGVFEESYAAGVDAGDAAEGDAVAALRRRVLPDAAARAARRRELDDLRRVAFDRTNSPEDEARAAEAHASLIALERAHHARKAALTAAVTAVLAAPTAAAPVPVSGQEPGVEVAAGDIRPPSLWRRLALPVGAFALGIAVAAVALPLLFTEDAPDPVADFAAGEGLLPPEPVEAGALRPGDLEAAERWLAQPQTQTDLVDLQFEDIDPSTTRLAAGGAGTGTTWVARDDDGGLCVVVTIGAANSFAASCSPPDMFVLHGATVSLNQGVAGTPSIEAAWDGAHVYVTVGPEGP
ncbi:hypothetical protein [Conyzicola nivalis]